MTSRDVAKQIISTSFRGILRVSPNTSGTSIEDQGLPESGTELSISDSAGNESPVSLSRKSITIAGNTFSVTSNTFSITSYSFSGSGNTINFTPTSQFTAKSPYILMGDSTKNYLKIDNTTTEDGDYLTIGNANSNNFIRINKATSPDGNIILESTSKINLSSPTINLKNTGSNHTINLESPSINLGTSKSQISINGHKFPKGVPSDTQVISGDSTNFSITNFKTILDMYIGDYFDTYIPIGMIVIWPSQTAIKNEKFLLCDGRPVNKNSYNGLYEIIKYTYGGSGDTFNLPNLTTKYIRGAYSSQVGTNIDEALPNIKGGFPSEFRDDYGYNLAKTFGAFYLPKGTSKDDDLNWEPADITDPESNYYGKYTLSGNVGTVYKRKTRFDASRSSSVYQDGASVTPNSVAMAYYIRVK